MPRDASASGRRTKTFPVHDRSKQTVLIPPVSAKETALAGSADWGSIRGSIHLRILKYFNYFNGIWRREWDSNPRYSFPHTRFPSVRLKPLGHLSGCHCLEGP